MLCARCSCLLVRASKSPKHLAGYLTLRDSVSQQAGLAGTPALFAIAGLPALLDNSKLTLFDRRFEMSSKGRFFQGLGHPRCSLEPWGRVLPPAMAPKALSRVAMLRTCTEAQKCSRFDIQLSSQMRFATASAGTPALFRSLCL